MEFTVNKESLIQRLRPVAGVVDGTDEGILRNIRITCKNGLVSLCGSNQSVALASEIDPIQIKKEGEVVVPANTLLNLCKNFSHGASITLRKKAGFTQVLSEKLTYRLNGPDSTSYPVYSEGAEVSQVTVPQGKLKSAIRALKHAMPVNCPMYAVNGMLFEVEDGVLNLVTTDTTRLGVYCINEGVSSEDRIRHTVPEPTVRILESLLSDSADEVSLNFSSGKFSASLKGFEINSKMIESTFPEWRSIVESKTLRTILASRDDMLQAMENGLAIADGTNLPIKMTTSKDSCLFTAQSSLGDIRDSISGSVTGGRVDIMFNAKFLKQSLGSIPSGTITIKISSKGKAFTLLSEIDENMTFAIFPLAMEE